MPLAIRTVRWTWPANEDNRPMDHKMIPKLKPETEAIIADVFR